jgi:cation:H+ antiporter
VSGSVRPMLLAVLGVIAGLVLLTFAADQFVIGAARLAVVLRLSTVVVGAVVIGFGTSAPELLVTALAGARGSIDLAVANVVGSNVANLTLVLGAAALVTPIAVHATVLKREAPLSLVAVLVFGALTFFPLGVVGGVLLATLLVASLTFIVVSSRRSGVGDVELSAEVDEFLTDGDVRTRFEAGRTVVGLLGTLGGAQLLIVNATAIASSLGLSEGFIGLTVVAIGTSLPELATALQAARKDETDLIIGNLLGSNLFNAGAVGAVAMFVGAGQQVGPSVTTIAVPLMAIVAVVATVFMITGKRVVRWEAAVLIAAYLATLPFLAT